MNSVPSQISLEVVSTLSELCEQFRRHRLSVCCVEQDTAKEEILYLQRFFNYLGTSNAISNLFHNINPKNLSAFLIYYAKKYPPGSRRWMQMALRSFLRFAYCKLYLNEDLSTLVPAVRKPRMGHIPRALPASCIARLNEDIKPDSPCGRRDLAIVSLLSTYGVRGVQIRRLRLKHIDWSNNIINFPPAKGGKWISQELTPATGNRLSDYILHERPESEFPEVFLTVKPPHPISSSSYLSSILRGRLEQLDVELPEGVSWGTHGFRHEFASRLVANVSFKELADMLGHRDPSSTLIYGKIDIKTLRKAALPWPGGEK